MARTRTYLMGLAVVVALVAGAVAGPAQAGNAVCPSLCLTGGVLSRGSSAVTASGAHNNGNGMIVKNYVFTMLAADLTGASPVQSVRISITVAGHAGGTSFSGHATLTNTEGSSVTVPVSGSDDGVLISYSGGGLNLNALSLGAGEATFLRNQDWPAPGGEECDGHDNGGGVGHIIGGGQGHDCDQG